MATPLTAAGAYAQVARLGNAPAGLNKAFGGAAEGPSFSAAMREALASVRQAGVKSDTQTQAMVAGTKSNIVDVVTAVAETETAINTLVSVRDKVVAAYEQIMQMPI